jgi:hypothetical protein
MSKKNDHGELLELVRNLPSAEQRRVLDFARALSASRPRGVPGNELLRFAGTILSEDLTRMSEAIEEGCEQVDIHAW